MIILDRWNRRVTFIPLLLQIKTIVCLSDPSFVHKVFEGIKVSKYAESLNDLNKLYQHLSPKAAVEKEVIKRVWEEYSKTHG